MELRHIRYFLAVAEEKNFTRAALKVGIGQSPLSQQIKDLEREVGAPLFHRVPHGAELTAAGNAFLEIARHFPTMSDRALNAAQRASRGEIGSLNIGFTASSAFNAVVPGAIRSYRRAYPDVELTLSEFNTTLLVQHLGDGTLDAVFLRPGAPRTDILQSRLLSEEPMVMALPATHPVADRTEVDLADLENDPLMLFPRSAGPAFYDSIITAFRAAGVEPRLGQTAPQIASVVNLVAAELGISMVPASMAQVSVAGVVFRSIRGETPVARIALATRRGETSTIIRNFVSRAVS